MWFVCITVVVLAFVVVGFGLCAVVFVVALFLSLLGIDGWVGVGFGCFGFVVVV